MNSDKFVQSLLVGIITMVVGFFVEKVVIHHFKSCSKSQDVSKKPIKQVTFFLVGMTMYMLPDTVEMVRGILEI